MAQDNINHTALFAADSARLQEVAGLNAEIILHRGRWKNGGEMLTTAFSCKPAERGEKV
jgi:hypothetical protein